MLLYCSVLLFVCWCIYSVLACSFYFSRSTDCHSYAFVFAFSRRSLIPIIVASVLRDGIWLVGVFVILFCISILLHRCSATLCNRLTCHVERHISQYISKFMHTRASIHPCTFPCMHDESPKCHTTLLAFQNLVMGRMCIRVGLYFARLARNSCLFCLSWQPHLHLLLSVC